MEIGKIQYPGYFELAGYYINDIKKLENPEADIIKSQNRNKAVVGCVTNVMKPGKANQVSLQDNKWISEDK